MKQMTTQETLNQWITRYEFVENWLAGILERERKISKKEAIGQVQDACEKFFRLREFND